jgi:hypothetical protein
MDSSINDWSYNQFLAFLLMYSASSDYKFTQEEKEFIKSHTGDVSFSQIEEVLNEYSDYEIVQTIMSFKDKYYPTTNEKEKIFEDMKKLFLLDETFSPNEQNLYRALRELLSSLK